MIAQLQTENKVLSERSFMPVFTDLLQRKCSCGTHTPAGGECEECKKKQALQRKANDQSEVSEVPLIVHEVLRSPGQLLDPETRAYMELHFGHDFSQVRVHTDGKAAESARAVNALAYTIGQNIVFGQGQYSPQTNSGRRLMAHELTHTVQQSRGGVSTLSGSMRVSRPGNANEREAETVTEKVVAAGSNEISVPNIHSATSAIQRIGDPTKVPPGVELECEIASDSPLAPAEQLLFGNNSSTLSTLQQAQIDNFVLNWQAAGGNAPVRVDGYASTPGTDELNWRLSCNRAEEVVNELTTPSSVIPGIPVDVIRTVAQGETTEFGAEANNRRATISSPITLPPTPPAPPTPAPCTLPQSLGSARGCGSGNDFAHFDFPSISAASEAKLATWAAVHNSSHLPFRSLVSDGDCMLEMVGVLTSLAGGAGYAAYSRFAAGTGGTETHGPASALGSMALGCGSFLATIIRVKAEIEAQLAAQSASGVLNPCALSVTPPETHFEFSDGRALKAVIGGTQGEELFVTGFTGSIPERSYSIDLRFIICDDFGVDESDLYFAGLFAFWVLQHERSATRYVPFINQLDLPVTMRGTF